MILTWYKICIPELHWFYNTLQWTHTSHYSEGKKQWSMEEKIIFFYIKKYNIPGI